MTGETEPATELDPMTYALMQSFGHVSHGIGHDSSSLIVPYEPVIMAIMLWLIRALTLRMCLLHIG